MPRQQVTKSRTCRGRAILIQFEEDHIRCTQQAPNSQAYIRSQADAGWSLLRAKYDDGGFSGDLSSALLQGQPERAGGVSRIPAAEIEGLVVRSVRDHLNQSAETEDPVLINTHVARIEVQADQLVIELADAKGIRSKRPRGRKVLKVSWRKSPSRRRREILVPASVPPQDARAIRSENRALLIASIARGRRWLDELITDPTANAESIATRDGCSVRSPEKAGQRAVSMRSKDAFRMAWGLSASPTCLPNGPASTRCLGFRPSSPIRTESLPTAVSVAGKRDFLAREKCANTSPEPRISGLRDQAVVQKPANSGPSSTTIGNPRNRRNAWWAREDSNLQPDHYIRTLAVRMPHIVFQLSPGISSNAGR